MNEDFLKQIIAELIYSNGQAIGLILAAVARQVDAQQLTDDLRAQIAAAKQHGMSTMALDLASHALAAAEAETALQNPDRH